MTRILRAAVPCTLVFLVASCATTKGSFNLDWSGLEQEQKNTAPISSSPEVEMFNLRVSLLQIVKTSTTGTGANRKTQTEYPQAVYGANLGNGLCIDAENNIFLDVFSLLKIDTDNPFDIKFGVDRIRKARDSYQLLNFAGVATDIAASSTAVHLKSLVTQWGYTVEGSTYRYKAPIPLLANYDMDVSPTKLKIVVWKIIPIAQEVTLQDNKAEIWGNYTVTKQGDTYAIRTHALFSKTYKVYYAGSHILFCEGDAVFSDIVIKPGEITVNGQTAIQYSVGG